MNVLKKAANMMSERLDSSAGTQQVYADMRHRFARARQINFPDLGVVSSAAVKWLIVHHTSQIGCREGALFVPLLTCCSHMMGVNTSIKVNDLWSEPSILWTVVCARRGTGKTAILKQLIPSLLELQCEHERQWHLSRPSSSQGLGSASPPKLICGATSLEELYKILGKNGGQMLTLEENLENLHKCLLTDKDGSLMQGEELHNLYDAMPKFSSKDGEVSIMTTTCYNHFGMASPSYVMELHHNDRLKLFDRYLISCPDDLSTDENQTDVVPAPSKLPSIKVILQTLYMFHKQPREYVLNPEATQELHRFRDYDIPRVKAQVKQHENSRLVIDKSLGQIVRIAGAIKALTTACDFATQPSGHQYLQWDLTIDKDTVLKAIRLQRYFLEQKMVLLHDMSVFSDHSVLCAPSTSYHHVQSTSQSPVTEPTLASYLESRSPSSTEFPDGFIPDFVSMSLPQFVANYSNKIRRLLEYADDGNGIPASAAAQYSIPPIVHIPGSSNRKPTWVAELFFKKVAELGIGRLCYIKHQTNRKFFLRFRRKRQEQLTDGDRLLLDTLRVNMDLFCRVGNEQLPAEVMSLVDRGLSPFGPMDIHSYERSPHVTCSVEPPVSLSNDTPIKRELEFDEDDAKN